MSYITTFKNTTKKLHSLTSHFTHSRNNGLNPQSTRIKLVLVWCSSFFSCITLLINGMFPAITRKKINTRNTQNHQ